MAENYNKEPEKEHPFKYRWLEDLDWQDPMDAETNTVKANTVPARIPFPVPEGWTMLKPPGGR